VQFLSSHRNSASQLGTLTNVKWNERTAKHSIVRVLIIAAGCIYSASKPTKPNTAMPLFLLRSRIPLAGYDSQACLSAARSVLKLQYRRYCRLKDIQPFGACFRRRF
jgi:hypothetical protein